MTIDEIIDELEIYTAGRLKKAKVHITVEELQKFIDEIKVLKQEPKSEWQKDHEDNKRLKEIQDEAHGSLNALMATLYNKGYQDGEKALAEHHKLCRNEADGTDEVLDKIRAEIIKYERDCRLTVDDYTCSRCTDNVFNSIYNIIDKCKVGSEGTETN